MKPLTFTSTPIKGHGRGKGLGTPTINLDLTQVPELENGVYAVIATMNGTRYKATMHYGRPLVFNDELACEIHLLDQVIEEAPNSLTIEVVEFFRPTQDFPSIDALKEQIKKDNDRARAILSL